MIKLLGALAEQHRLCLVTHHLTAPNHKGSVFQI